MNQEIVYSAGETPTHLTKNMAYALVIAFTIIGIMASHSEQAALNRIEDSLKIHVH